MADRFFSRRVIQNSHVSRPVSGRVFVWLSVAAIAGTLISCSLLVSAQQHFGAVKLGYEREALKVTGAGLEQELQKLQLERDKVASLKEIEKRASQAGMVADTPASVRGAGSQHSPR
jgi:hypothetical protein